MFSKRIPILRRPPTHIGALLSNGNHSSLVALYDADLVESMYGEGRELDNGANNLSSASARFSDSNIHRMTMSGDTVRVDKTWLEVDDDNPT